MTVEAIFQDLIDEIKAMRSDLSRLQSSGLSPSDGERLEDGIKNLVKVIASHEASIKTASSEGARRAINELSGSLLKELRLSIDSYTKAAGEARRASWLSFGGYWAWSIAFTMVGLVLGLMGAFMLSDLYFGLDFDPSRHCEVTGGQIQVNNEGHKFCYFWFK